MANSEGFPTSSSWTSDTMPNSTLLPDPSRKTIACEACRKQKVTQQIVDNISDGSHVDTLFRSGVTWMVLNHLAGDVEKRAYLVQ